MPEYAVSVEMRPPEWLAELDELQVAGAESLLDGALRRVFGATNAQGATIDRLHHQIVVHATGARLHLTVEAPNIIDAEGAAEAMLHEALLSCEPLRRWRIDKCEVGLDEETFRMHMDGSED